MRGMRNVGEKTFAGISLIDSVSACLGFALFSTARRISVSARPLVAAMDGVFRASGGWRNFAGQRLKAIPLKGRAV